MIIRNLLLSSLLIIVSIPGCRKEKLKNECNKLTEAMRNDNVQEAGAVINQFIRRLPDSRHSAANFDKLVSSIRSTCSLTAEAVCFACIKTMPEQSEISVSFQSGAVTVTRIFDISYNLADDKMEFVNMHN